MSNDTNLQDLKYNDLKALAKERGLDASGTKEELVARIEAAGGTTPQPPATGENTSNPTTAGETVKPILTPAQERAEETKAEKGLRADAAAMKKHLDAQPKVSIMIPFETGENPERGKLIPFHVNLNGYAMNLPRGQYIEVPKQVADVIKERLESEGKIGREWRLDAMPEALQG